MTIHENKHLQNVLYYLNNNNRNSKKHLIKPRITYTGRLNLP